MEKEKLNPEEFIRAEEELHELKEQRGIPEKEGFISRLVSKYYAIKDKHVAVSVPKKRYMLFLLLTGWMGGHLFYTKHYIKASAYLLLCWTGFPLAMAIIDALAAIPMKVDENGMVEL